jgi:mycothiol synthase
MRSDLIVRPFEDSDAEAIRAIITRADDEGELVGFNRSDVRAWFVMVPDERLGTWVATRSGTVIGFLSVTANALLVLPEHRRRGVGRALVRAALPANPKLELSQFSGSDASAAFLSAMRFRPDHRLLRMLRPGSSLPAEPVLPSGFEFAQYQHELFDAFFALLGTSFADHPTPLHLDEALVRSVHARPEFNPASIQLITLNGDAQQPVAFVRTRTSEPDDGTKRGSIALLGVLPDYRGRGFARQLLRWGIRSFMEAGVNDVEIEVVTGNDHALTLYTSEGFEQLCSWAYWVPETPPSS